jgi:hypothetical protein
MPPTADLPTRIYTPASPLAQPGLLWREMVADLWAGRELAWRLAVLWALIIPLPNTVISAASSAATRPIAPASIRMLCWPASPMPTRPN